MIKRRKAPHLAEGWPFSPGVVSVKCLANVQIGWKHVWSRKRQAGEQTIHFGLNLIIFEKRRRRIVCGEFFEKIGRD